MLMQFQLLTDAECDELSCMSCAGAIEGRIYSGDSANGAAHKPETYKAREVYLDVLDSRLEWLRLKLECALFAVGEHLNIGPLRLVEMPRLLTYETGGLFDWHVDASPLPVGPARKLTVAIQISDGGDYEGGDLQVIGDGGCKTATKRRGHAAAFRSHLRHSVRPIIAGKRLALVAWGYG